MIINHKFFNRLQKNEIMCRCYSKKEKRSYWRIEYIYTIDTFPFYLLNNREVYNKGRGKNTKRYLNIPITFDIETSNLEKFREDNTRYAVGFMYQWQVCVDNAVIFGRTWQEFISFFTKLVEEKRKIYGDLIIIPIYVHYLSFEFQFIKDFIKWREVFAKEKRKVVTALSVNELEFRCSYFLSNMSLAKLCENSELCYHYKLKDKFDYSKVRTFTTPLTNTERGYCYNDVRGLSECIQSYMLEDNLASIPLTNTGFVRRDFRKAVLKNRKNKFDQQKNALTVEQYSLLERMFRGGNTHANHLYTAQTLKNVHSVDMQSSYLGVMLMDYFPCTPLTEVHIDTFEKLKKYTSKYCCMMSVDFLNISIKDQNPVPYIDISHCGKYHNIVNDNGRIMSAEYIQDYPLTEIDLKIIMNTYNIEEIRINKCYISKRGKINDEYRKEIMKWYTAKTMLKGVAEKEYEYMKSKNKANSSFGMTVQKMITEEVIYDGDWSVQKKELQEVLQEFYDNYSTFTQYQIGIYTTAHARRRLQQGIDICSHYDHDCSDFVYGDTDSCKFVGEQHIEEFKKINEKIRKECENNDITAYVDRDGKRYYLSVWDYEGCYDEFKTFGAKKYCFLKDNKFEITVAGMNKLKGSKAVGSCDNFKLGNEYSNVGRTTSWYNDDKIHQITVNGDTFVTASNIGVLETTYTLGVTKEYFELIKINPNFFYD